MRLKRGYERYREEEEMWYVTAAQIRIHCLNVWCICFPEIFWSADSKMLSKEHTHTHLITTLSRLLYVHNSEFCAGFVKQE